MLEPTGGGLADRIALVGPTAAGKTAVGIELARRLGAEIISADSVQVYRHLDIGTAKPTGAEQARAIFHVLDVADPDQDWTLADFQGLGERLCAEIARRGNVPLIVGGTGLYVRALTTRLDLPAVPPDEDLRARWRAFARTQGNAALLDALARVDPETAARLHVNDIGRQIRALEVHAALGRTLTDLHADNRARQVGDAPRLFGLSFEDRSALYARIDARVDQMLADGLLDEVRALRARGYSAGLKPMASLGYRQMNAFLAGGCGWEAAVAAMKQETRRFARRQMIWFRADARIRWVEAGDRSPADIADEIRREIDTPPPRVGPQECETP